ncbi:regucalcin-like [Belonocnema kinseyi]|uniref:regucalcin-like n=1 Tax=Belonocnema kinseyi TaxID=2817044 RepID=UPI00143DC71A|nr:regucalcin-like [Belonocnema kinseyi]
MDPSLSHNSQYIWPIGMNPSLSHVVQPSWPFGVDLSLSHGMQHNSQLTSQPSLTHGSQPNQEYWKEIIVKDLGYSEVAFWHIDKLFYIDSYASKLCAYAAKTRDTTCCTIGLGPLSFAVPVLGYPNEFVVGVATSIILILWDTSTSFQYPFYFVLKSKEGLPPGTRWNYGSVDQNSKIIIGTTNDLPDAREGNLGSVWAFGQNKNLLLKLDNLSTITGGFAWGPRPVKEKAEKTPPVKLYFADTVKDEVVTYEVLQNRDTKIKCQKKLFYLPEHGVNGDPGRIAIDDRGFLWVPLIGGHGVIEFNPVAKKTNRIIKLPAAKVGACTFGGPHLDILYVSTIGYEYKEPREHRPQGDLGGHIFAIHGLKVKGIPTREFTVFPDGLPDQILSSREIIKREKMLVARRQSGITRRTKAARVET